MKRILIFTAGFGEGHNTAARNIQEAIESIAPEEAHVEIVDLFESCYGRFNGMLRQAYLAAINRTPLLWKGIYSFFDRTTVLEDGISALARMQRSLDWLLREVQPDAVVCTYPIYNYLIDEIFRDGRRKNFFHITVVTDSITINSFWYRGPSDVFVVPNEETAVTLRAAGVEESRIQVFGFPVHLDFLEAQEIGLADELEGDPRILYIINSGKKKATKIIRLLLHHPRWCATVVVGRDLALLEEVRRLVKGAEEKIRVLGWTDKIPELLLTHHVLISKAGGATVQEAVAARCPMVVTQVVPGQEEGNFDLLRRRGAALYAEKPRQILQALEELFADQGRLWKRIRSALGGISRPDASIQIARFVLERAAIENVAPANLPGFSRTLRDLGVAADGVPDSGKAAQVLLCDFHIHTTYSDGRLSVGEIVDFYGQRGFDCICITDHIVDRTRFLGRVCQLTGLVLSPDRVEEYFDVLRRERERAWRKYRMILFAGLEFNKDGYRAKSSAHLLGVDLRGPIDPSLPLPEIIAEIRAQGGLSVASHPHKFQSVWGPNTLYLWENQKQFAPLLDAWEIANRDDLFAPIGLKRLPFIANSDFHKPKHIDSWKTVLFCEKDPEAIKECVRINRNVALTLYRRHRFGSLLRCPEEELVRV
ncbi:UDP-N-acetylglucosamine:LPS N-acetylglucosamine transferase fused to PHP family phosphoesterase [Methylacidimicrobium sp. AP8]|uniref:MGDG synthase family glycosyltransferase n=1 Tax=Methylacidimicrobium sp. AP8 TaxID=2730359 RepID=UPI0018C04734|nr:glycosyltransferase [Methylacidimicrobium sp. AP8]CAB4243121.1 UDP-N-acetylglucosamine:LPS N-acetylglucosamine transferase fused to PHP family phosphoesterase [Methylacidimicrobium sp. AP8]